MTRRIMLVMMKLRCVTRFLYSRPMIKRILRRVCWEAVPPEADRNGPLLLFRDVPFLVFPQCSLPWFLFLFYAEDRRWNIWQGTRPHQFNEDIGQRWLGQLETADDAAVLQRGFYDHVGIKMA